MKLRRTMLYIPGNNPSMLLNSGIYGADTLLLDLEDGVALSEKDSARILLRHAIKNLDFGRSEVLVRINPLDTPFGKDDLEMIIPAGPDGIRVPKTSSAKDIKMVDEILSEIEEKNNIPIGKTTIMPMLETAQGVKNAYEVAIASKRITAITFGGEDFTADMGIKRTPDGSNMYTARSEIAIAAKAAGVDAIDTVYSDVNDEEGLKNETRLIKDLGFAGKGCINPRQVAPIHEVYTPTEEEIEYAQRVVNAMKEAEKNNSGIVSLNGRMIDKPVMLRAEKVLIYAKAAGAI